MRQELEIQRQQRVSTGSNCAAKLCRSEIPLVESRRQLLDLWQMTILVEFMSENSRTSEFLLLRLTPVCRRHFLPETMRTNHTLTENKCDMIFALLEFFTVLL